MSIELIPANIHIPATTGTASAIAATNDIDAISEWIRARGLRSQHTKDSYRREANRLLVWLCETHLTLNEMRVEDVHAFFQHLAAPPAHWIRPRKPKKGEQLAATQLLIKPLGPVSTLHARTVLAQMASYLNDAGYLSQNVWRLSVRPVVMQTTMASRSLDLPSWQYLQAWIANMPRFRPRDIQHASRARWLFALLYNTGIRCAEVVNGTMGDFVRTNAAWTLRVIGKGQRERFVTVNSTLMHELTAYRTSIGLPAYPVPSEKTPLVISVSTQRSSKHMTTRAIGKIVSEIAQSAAAACSDEHISGRLEHMSAHWMRHTNATHRLMAGATLDTTQDELGHRDPRTTRIYAETGSEQRRQDAERLVNLNNEIGNS